MQVAHFSSAADIRASTTSCIRHVTVSGDGLTVVVVDGPTGDAMSCITFCTRLCICQLNLKFSCMFVRFNDSLSSPPLDHYELRDSLMTVRTMACTRRAKLFIKLDLGLDGSSIMLLKCISLVKLLQIVSRCVCLCFIK